VSLDVHLYEPIAELAPFELCLECIVSTDDGDTDHRHENLVFTRNITHNLGKMADAAGIYEACWRPEELMGAAPRVCARDISELLLKGLEMLRRDPERFRKFEPENQWGRYPDLVEFVGAYLKACMANPDAIVRVSR